MFFFRIHVVDTILWKPILQFFSVNSDPSSVVNCGVVAAGRRARDWGNSRQKPAMYLHIQRIPTGDGALPPYTGIRSMAPKLTAEVPQTN